MTDGSATGSVLVPASPYGPFVGLSLHVHDLANTGRWDEALTAADEYQSIARAFGDEKTVDFVIQGRMFTYQYLGNLAEAMAVGRQLLDRHQTAGNLLGEAKALADLADLGVLSGQLAEGMRYLARAGLLLDTTTRRNDRYASALAAYAQAASNAGLYEVAGTAFEQVMQYHAAYGEPPRNYLEFRYLALLVSWAFRLDQLGHTLAAGNRLRRGAAITAAWLDTYGDSGSDDMYVAADRWEMAAIRALILAKLGHADQAIALAEPVVPKLRELSLDPGMWAAHLALGIALRIRGGYTSARRELLAARETCGRSGLADDEQIVAHELAILAAQTHGDRVSRDLVEALAVQARLLWQQRLQRLAMLHHARGREEAEIERAHAEAALLRDPLTGLGNRRHYDQLTAAIDAGQLPKPISLLVIDVDKFKAINDTYSHAAGDAVLRKVSALLAAHCRTGQDVPIRYAGDEFAVFCHSELASAIDIAERLRTAIANADFSDIAAGAPVSISIGAAELEPTMTADDLFHAADASLYQAKRDGRDRVAANLRSAHRQ